MKSLEEEFSLFPCEKCGGVGEERIGEGLPWFLCGAFMGQDMGTYVRCKRCGHRTDAYDEPWKAIRAWNKQPMKQFLEDE